MGNLSDIFPAATGNNVLEVISGTCDGRVITVPSGNYTLQSVTAATNLSTSYVDILGSSIAYTPPSDTKYVLYRFNFKWDSKGSSGISHFRLYVDSTEIIPAYSHFASQYKGAHTSQHGSFTNTMEYVFDLTAASDDAANGKFSNWTSSKTIKVTGREYNSTYQAAANANTYEDGTSASGNEVFTKPLLTVIAYS